jgi:hypothetical protein
LQIVQPASRTLDTKALDREARIVKRLYLPVLFVCALLALPYVLSKGGSDVAVPALPAVREVFAPAQPAAGNTMLRSVVIGAGGGVITSTNFTARVTVGEPVAGALLTSTNYSVCFGFQCTTGAVQRNVFMPSVVRTPPCDPFEPNNTRTAPDLPVVASGANNTAKLCYAGDEDNYRFAKSADGDVTIAFSGLHSSVNGHLQYFVYNTLALGQNDNILTCQGQSLAISGSPSFVCPNLPAGSYVLRLYADNNAGSDAATYSFRVTY